MGLLKTPAKKPPMRMGGTGATSISSLRPQQVEKLAPCIGNCPSCADVRGWITTIAQREKMGLDEEAAFEKAWRIIVDRNPFPAVMGRVCPHPCEAGCNRKDKDGSVAVNSMERFLGDFALERGFNLETIDAEPKAESIGVIGAGPAGLSCAYQLARRGYKVTVYEAFPGGGGMLRYGIPRYRLPLDVLDGEIKRIQDLGVDIRYNTAVGREVKIEELRAQHKAIFVGIGAHRGKSMGVPGEDGPGVMTGAEFLNKVNSGDAVDVGKKVIVIGGGDTAIDAARVARRLGAEVAIVYRRTRTEMPAIDSEVEQALEENVEITFLAAPVAVNRDGGLKLVVQRMELGEPDASGRRRPVPVAGSEYEIPADLIIAAISQEPEIERVSDLGASNGWFKADADFKVTEGIWAGGDDVELGLATIAIYQGRRAAETIHASLRGIEPPAIKDPRPPVPPERLKMASYDAKPRNERGTMAAAERLANPEAEVDEGITREQLLDEVSRCLSCGQCFDCEKCWMYCQYNCFVKLEDKRPGHYLKVKTEMCDGCKKCAEECPCGFLEMI